MSGYNKLGTFWPPNGWDELGFISEMQKQAIAKDPVLATITGTHYIIEAIPVYLKNKTRSYIYNIRINGWKYSIQNESREYNILSFSLQERPKKSLSKDYYISNLKTKSRPLLLSPRSAQRVYIAAIFMIKQIQSGQVPDHNRILRLYKIHPSQRSLYELDYEREDSRNCGLPTYCYDTISDKEIL